MSPDDHTLIAETARATRRDRDGVVVVHGTDRLAVSGDRVVELVGTPASPIVFTGAMRPYELRSTDALAEPDRGAARRAARRAGRLRRDAQPGAAVPRRGQGSRAGTFVQGASERVDACRSRADRCRRYSTRSTRADIGVVIFAHRGTAGSRSGYANDTAIRAARLHRRRMAGDARCSTRSRPSSATIVGAAVRSASRAAHPMPLASSSSRSRTATASELRAELAVGARRAPATGARDRARDAATSARTRRRSCRCSRPIGSRSSARSPPASRTRSTTR